MSKTSRLQAKTLQGIPFLPAKFHDLLDQTLLLNLSIRHRFVDQNPGFVYSETQIRMMPWRDTQRRLCCFDFSKTMQYVYAIIYGVFEMFYLLFATAQNIVMKCKTYKCGRTRAAEG